MKVITYLLVSMIFDKSTSFLNLTIFHNTDMYSRFEETLDYKSEKMIGGFSRLAQVLEHERSSLLPRSSHCILYLNAGNTFTGTYLYHIYRWRIVASLMNILNPDAVALGSQEFVDGLHGLEPFLEAVNFSVVASNIHAENGTIFSKRVHPSVVLNLNGVSVGIIGYTAKDTQRKYPVGNLKFDDELTSVQRECKRMDKLGVKIVIALGNADFGTDFNIAKEAECLDVVVGGDSKLFLWNDDPNKLIEDNPSSTYPMVIKNVKGNDVPLLEGYTKTKYLGKINLIFDSNGNLQSYKGNPILLDEDVLTKEDKVTPLLRDFTGGYRSTEVNKTVLGKVSVFLSADKCRQEECNFGNMLADAFIDYKASQYKGKYWTDTPLAFINAGAIRHSINTSVHEFNLLANDLSSAIPYMNPLITVVLQGEDLREVLEVGARYDGETRRGEFLMVSGLRVIYDFSKNPYRRVLSVLVRCGKCRTPSYSPLVFNEYYRIITTVYLANGGDGFTTIRKSSLSFALEGVNELEAVESYLKRYGSIRPECEDRISHMKFVGSSERSLLYSYRQYCIISLSVLFLYRF